MNRRQLFKRSLYFLTGWVGAKYSPYLMGSISKEDIPFIEKLKLLLKSYKGFGSVEISSETGIAEVIKNLNNLSIANESYDNVGNAIGNLIREDYINFNTSELDGWILSKTEIDLLAYRSYLYPRKNKQKNKQKKSYINSINKDFIKITKWGPKKTCVGKPFNQQLDGHSSNWFSVDGYVGVLHVYFGENRIKSTFKGGIVTTRIDGEEFLELTRQNSHHKIFFYNPVDNIKQYIGDFIVESKKCCSVNIDGNKSKVFGKIESWGPKSTKKLMAFNIQKDGTSAIWIKTLCAPINSVIYIDNIEIATTVHQNIVIGKINGLAMLKDRKQMEVFIVNKYKLEKVKVGNFYVK